MPLNSNIITFTIIVLGAALLCLAQDLSAQQRPLSLKVVFENDFLIGTALNRRQIEERDTGSARLINRHFNAITPENIMKAGEIHPEWDVYRFDLADKILDYAEKNNIKVNGHTLVWHSQLPDFVQRI